MAAKKVNSFKDLSLGKRAAIIGGGAIIGYFLLKRFFGSNVQKAPVNYGQIPIVYTAGGSNVLWNPDPLAKDIAEKLIGYNFNTYPEAVAPILPLNNDQLALLYNHYNAYYADKEYPTLTKQIDSEWADWDGVYKQAVAKLQGQGLNESGRQNKGLTALRRNGYLR